MTGTLDFRLGELFADVARCSFLDDAEIEQMVEGKISDARRSDWKQHAATCVACAELLRDLQERGDLVKKGSPGVPPSKLPQAERVAGSERS